MELRMISKSIESAEGKRWILNDIARESTWFYFSCAYGDWCEDSPKAPKSKKKISWFCCVRESFWFSLCLQYHLVHYETAAFPVEKAHTRTQYGILGQLKFQNVSIPNNTSLKYIMMLSLFRLSLIIWQATVSRFVDVRENASHKIQMILHSFGIITHILKSQWNFTFKITAYGYQIQNQSMRERKNIEAEAQITSDIDDTVFFVLLLPVFYPLTTWLNELKCEHKCIYIILYTKQ